MAWVISLLIGVVAGSRAMMAPAVVAWAAWLGWIDLGPTWAWFLGSGWTVLLFSALAIGELITDQLPTTPSREVPIQFGARLVSGAVSGAALGALSGITTIGLILGVVGAALGTLGGTEPTARRR